MSRRKLEQAYGGRKVVLRGISPRADGSMLARNCSGKPLNNLELVEHLCAVSGALAGARRAHVLNLGSLQPHVFMGDVLSCVRSCMKVDTKRERRPELQAILDVLDMAAGAADQDTRHVIAASFMHDGEREAFFVELRPLLGPKLQALPRVK